jgi:predicted dinucleotide-binding enzyme
MSVHDGMVSDFDPRRALLDGVPETVIAQALPGAQLVKAFNHLPAGLLAEDPPINGGRRAVFLSSDNESAPATVERSPGRCGGPQQ